MKGVILGKSTILSKEVRYKEEKNILFIERLRKKCIFATIISKYF